MAAPVAHVAPGTGSADLLTYDEAAEALGVARLTIGTLIRRKKLHPVKVAGKREKYLHRAEVAHWAAIRRRYLTPAANPIIVPPPLGPFVVQPALPTGSESSSEDEDAERLLLGLAALDLAAEDSGPNVRAIGAVAVITGVLMLAALLCDQGKLSPSDKATLERMAEEARVTQYPRPLVRELQRRIAA